MFESLEQRRLLSVTITNNGGALQVKGGNGDNDFQVVEDNGNVTVYDNTVGTAPVYTDTGITSIAIYGNTGSDKILYNGNTIGAVIRGNSGVDFITVADNGTGSSDIDGESDNDTIVVARGNHTTVTGGSGDDFIEINTAASTPDDVSFANAETVIVAGSGNDTIMTVAGQNTINGGSGSDTVIDVGGTNTYVKVETVV